MRGVACMVLLIVGCAPETERLPALSATRSDTESVLIGTRSGCEWHRRDAAEDVLLATSRFACDQVEITFSTSRDRALVWELTNPPSIRLADFEARTVMPLPAPPAKGNSGSIRIGFDETGDVVALAVLEQSPHVHELVMGWLAGKRPYGHLVESVHRWKRTRWKGGATTHADYRRADDSLSRGTLRTTDFTAEWPLDE